MDDLAAWLRAQLDHHANVHRKLVEAAGEDLPAEREADPDGFWAIYDAHRAILDLHTPRRDHTVDGDLVCSACVYSGVDEDEGGNRVGYREHEDWPCPTVRALGLAYQHADGYREEWRP